MHFGVTVIKVIIFYPKFPRCTILLYCEGNNLLFSTFLMHSIWWNGLHRLILQCNLWYFVRRCCHLGNQLTTSSLVLGIVKHLYYGQAQVYIMPIDCIELLYFYAQKQLLLSSRLSHLNSVRLSMSVCLSVCPSNRHTEARFALFSLRISDILT